MYCLSLFWSIDDVDDDDDDDVVFFLPYLMISSFFPTYLTTYLPTKGLPMEDRVRICTRAAPKCLKDRTSRWASPPRVDIHRRGDKVCM